VEDGVRVVRGMPLWHDGLGLYGKADVVELRVAPGDDSGRELKWWGTRWRSGGPQIVSVTPVEYKVGERRSWVHEAIQLCAQALCLEEMLGVAVPAGAVYYRGSRRRREVPIDSALRAQTERAIEDVRAMLRSGRLPPAVDDPRCPNCSLIESCLPGIVSNGRRVGAFRAFLYRPAEEAAEGRG
jgi:CRISPR-associated exonuclease Cas4